MKPTGYIVMESCEDWEQALRIVKGGGYPEGGILDWMSSQKNPRAMFGTREAARAAIDRTEHYRLAFGRTNLPEKKLCHVVPVQFTQ